MNVSYPITTGVYI